MLFKRAIITLRKIRLVLVVFGLTLFALGLYLLFQQKALTITDLNISIPHWGLVWVLVLAMILNWGIEIGKWYHINTREKLSYINALKGVMAGISTSLFFPLKTGAFIGRYVFTPHVAHKQFMKRLLLTNASQKGITIILGVLATLVTGATTLLSQDFWLIFGLVLVFTTFVFMRKPSWLQVLINEKTWTQLGLSFLRYVIFSSQLYLAFYMVGLNLSLAHVWYIPIYWFIISVVPFSFFGGLLVRETVGASLFGYLLGYDEPMIIVALFMIWAVNVFTPASLGWFFWLKKART